MPACTRRARVRRQVGAPARAHAQARTALARVCACASRALAGGRECTEEAARGALLREKGQQVRAVRAALLSGVEDDHHYSLAPLGPQRARQELERNAGQRERGLRLALRLPLGPQLLEPRRPGTREGIVARAIAARAAPLLLFAAPTAFVVSTAGRGLGAARAGRLPSATQGEPSHEPVLEFSLRAHEHANTLSALLRSPTGAMRARRHHNLLTPCRERPLRARRTCTRRDSACPSRSRRSLFSQHVSHSGTDSLTLARAAETAGCACGAVGCEPFAHNRFGRRGGGQLSTEPSMRSQFDKQTLNFILFC